MSAIQPISPAKARKAKVTVIPVYVIQSVNELIVKNLRNGTATFRQDELISLIASKEGENAADELCRKGYLDFEPVYRELGWDVVYDKPGYNEDYPATFKFTAKDKIS